MVTENMNYSKSELEILFTNKYRTNHWGSNESVSGPGSEMRQTEAIRAALPRIFFEYEIQTILDIPCGDFNWMQHVQGLSKLRYIGADIVKPLIESNNEKYGNSKHLEFIQLDITKDDLPHVDLIFTRDCFVHLENDDVCSAIENIKRSRSKLLLATTYPAETTNTDTSEGKWRPLNLEIDPFCLPKPIEFIDTDYTNGGTQHPGNGMGLWKIAEL